MRSVKSFAETLSTQREKTEKEEAALGGGTLVWRGYKSIFVDHT